MCCVNEYKLFVTWFVMFYSFSLRTLCRGLEYAIKQAHMSPMRAVYEV